METILQKVEEYRQQLQNREIFDFDIWWDPLFKDGFFVYDDWEKQCEAFTKHGLNGGLVTSAKAARYDAAEGNAELFGLIDGSQYLGCMVLTPEMFYTSSGEKYVDDLVSRGFAAVRLFPSTYMHSVAPEDLKPIVESLESRGLPLLLWHTQVPFEAIDRLCRAFPNLNIVVEGHDRKLLYHSRQYMPLLMRHKNFFLETHNIVLYREFETIDTFAGCDNLLYGSYFPYYTPYNSIYSILAAEITDEKKSQILSGNANRILRHRGY